MEPQSNFAWAREKPPRPRNVPSLEVPTGIWRDPRVVKLREERLEDLVVYLYLLTGPQGNFSGLYPLRTDLAVEHTEFRGEPALRESLKRIKAQRLIDLDGDCIWVIDLASYRFGRPWPRPVSDADLRLRRIRAELIECPSAKLRKAFIEHYTETLHTRRMGVQA